MEDRENRAATAHHEAGHAVVALSRGRRVTSVVLYPSPRPDETGRPIHGECVHENRLSALSPEDRCSFGGNPNPGDRAYLEDNLLIALAGPIAEEMAAPGAVRRTTDRDDSLYIAATLEGGNTSSPATQRRLNEAERMVRSLLERRWAAVQVIAAGLLGAGSMDGARAQEIFAAHASSRSGD